MIDLSKLLRASKPPQPEETAFGLTDIGKIRENNEDYLLIDEAKQLFIVSDGMGGHRAGEIASLTATKAVDEYFSKDRIAMLADHGEEIEKEIRKSISIAHEKVQSIASDNPEYEGMGCTIVVTLLLGNCLHIGHVGDSRAYFSDGESIKLLTTDHTYVMELVKAGKLRMEDIRTSSIKNHLSQAIGAPISLNPSYTRHTLQPDHRIMLCTDGLWDTLSDRDILNTITQKRSKQYICKEFIRKANKAGGFDNITVLIIELAEGASQQEKKESDDDHAGEYGIVFSKPGENADR